MADILVVDDDKMILALIERILAGEGIVAHCVSSGEEALESIKEKSFAMMITDLNMPGLDGMELSRKGLEIAPQMSIIMNTGDISTKIIRIAMEIGISKVLAKPFLPKEMLQTIRVVMGTRGDLASATG